MQEEDTTDDFRKYVDSTIDRVPNYAFGKEDLKRKILLKASGSFLWVSLVINRLAEAHSEEEAESILNESILNEVATDMNDLYARMLESVVHNGRTALAKSIYTWALLSLRPLKIEGLQLALKMDSQTIANLERVVSAISGQLILVNWRPEAEIVHRTARMYLL
ncbi:hypothetical protein WAI453_010592 [Rhynchosporium graminicola]